MKALRILQVVSLLVVLAYLLLLHNENPYNVLLPFLPNLPAAMVIALALMLGWLIGWLPTKLRLWRIARERNQLTRELEELRRDLGHVKMPSAPAAPDRSAAAKVVKPGQPEPAASRSRP